MEKEEAFLTDRPRSVAGVKFSPENMRISLVGNGDRLRRFRRYGSMRAMRSAVLANDIVGVRCCIYMEFADNSKPH